MFGGEGPPLSLFPPTPLLQTAAPQVASPLLINMTRLINFMAACVENIPSFS